MVNGYNISQDEQQIFLDIQKHAQRLERKPGKRTLTQNRYLHKLIALFAIETGYTLEEAKVLLKRQCAFMVYEKNGQKFAKRSRDLDTKGLTEWIEWIKNYAGANGIHLPSADDYRRNWDELEKTIEKNKAFL